jgi:hypothetical protein
MTVQRDIDLFRNRRGNGYHANAHGEPDYMKRNTFSAGNVVAMIVALGLVAVLGYAYVIALGKGWRMIVVVHVAALFFLGCTMYLSDLRSFLVFWLVFSVSLQLHYYLLFQPVIGLESQPFISGITLDVVDLLLFLLYSHWALVVSMRKTASGITWGHPLGTVFVLWIAACLLSSLVKAKELNYAIFEVVVLVKGFFLYLYLVNNTRTQKDLRVIVYALLASATIHSIYILMQYATGQNYTLHGVLVRGFRGGYEGFRAVGFSGSWDSAAAMFSFVFPIFLTYFLTMEGRSRRLAALLGMSIVLAGLLCLKVRAGYVAVICSSLIVGLLSYFRGRISTVRFQRALVAGLALALVVSPFVVARFLGGTAGEERVPLMEMAWSMIEHNWVLGVGVNNFAFNIEQYLSPHLRYVWTYIVHNEYLLRLAETGVIGFSLYYLMLILASVRLWRATRSTDEWIYLASLGLFAAMIGSILPRLVSYYHYLGVYLEFTVILAVTQVMGDMEAGRLSETEHVAQPSDQHGASLRR